MQIPATPSTGCNEFYKLLLVRNDITLSNIRVAVCNAICPFENSEHIVVFRQSLYDSNAHLLICKLQHRMASLACMRTNATIIISSVCVQHVQCTCMYMKKSGGPEQKGILWTAISSLLALISAVQHDLLWDARGFIYMYMSFKVTYEDPA